MLRYSVVLILALFCAVSSIAQITTVSGTITDPNSIPYAFATVKAQLVSGGVPVSGQPTVTVNNQQTCSSGGFGSAPCQVPFQGTMGPISLDSTGSFTLNLQDNTQVTPSGSQWQFTVNLQPGELPPWGFGPRTCSSSISISGASQSISTILSAACPAITRAGTVTGVGGGASVTSVNLTMPVQYSVTGCPITTSGTCAVNWLNVMPNLFLGGPIVNGINGILDAQSFSAPTNLTTSTSATVKPSQANDWAIFVSQSDPSVSQTAPVSMSGGPGSWVTILNNGNFGLIASQILTAANPLTGTATLLTATTWAGLEFLVTSNGTPTTVQTARATGSISDGLSVSFLSNTTAGHAILVAVQGQPPATSIVSGSVTDSEGNNYSPIGISQTGSTAVVLAFLSTNIHGGTLDQVRYHTATGSLTFGAFNVIEITGLGPQTGQPAFETIPTAALPSGITTVQVFSNKNLASNVSLVANTLTNVDSITVNAVGGASPAFPTGGGSWRVQVCYYYFTTAGTGTYGESFVTDGTTNFAQFGREVVGALDGGGYEACGWSNTTYNGNSAVTFTVRAENQGAQTISTTSTLTAQPSHIQVLVQASN